MASASSISFLGIPNAWQFSNEQEEESKIKAALNKILENLSSPIEPSAMTGREVVVEDGSELGFSYSISQLCNSLGNEDNELKTTLINILNPRELSPSSHIIVKKLSTEDKCAVLKALSESKFDLKSFVAQNENQPYYKILSDLFKIYNQTDEFCPLERDIGKIDIMVEQQNQRSAVFKNLVDNDEIETTLKVTKNLPEQELAIKVLLEVLAMEYKFIDAISIAFKISDKNIKIKALQSILRIVRICYQDNQEIVNACVKLENYLSNCQIKIFSFQ